MKKILLQLAVSVIILRLASSSVYAAYVLPYPSTMPGNKIYRIMRIMDVVKGYWNFGEIAQAKYHLGLSDKYLVEAKTLFEYGQFLLAVDALGRSGEEFARVPAWLKRAAVSGKDVRVLSATAKDAAAKHIEVLDGLSVSMPESVEWHPEKSASTRLGIRSELSHAKTVRENSRLELP